VLAHGHHCKGEDALTFFVSILSILQNRVQFIALLRRDKWRFNLFLEFGQLQLWP